MTPTAVLVVDDDRGNCAIVSRRLVALGYRVDIAFDGESALQLARDNSYRLAVLDYQMPGMDGIELYEKLREVRPAVTGIFLTSYASINTIFPAIGVGIERVLSKPVDFRELIPLVEELAGKAA